MRRRLRACPPGNARLGAGWPHHRRGRLRRASLPASCREVPRRGDRDPLPDLPPGEAHPRHLRVRGRTRALRRPGKAGPRTCRDGRRIWGVPGVRRRGLSELWLEPPRHVLCSRHGRAARPARTPPGQGRARRVKYLATGEDPPGTMAGPQGKVANGHDAVHRQVRWSAVGWLPPPATGSSNQRGRVSNRDFPAPVPARPGPGRAHTRPARRAVSSAGSTVRQYPRRRPRLGGVRPWLRALGRPALGRSARGGRDGGRPRARRARRRAGGRRGGVREDLYSPAGARPARAGRSARPGSRDGARAPGVSAAPAAARRPSSAPASVTSGTTCATGCAATVSAATGTSRAAAGRCAGRGSGGGDWDGRTARTAASRAARAAGGGTGPGRRSWASSRPPSACSSSWPRPGWRTPTPRRRSPTSRRASFAAEVQGLLQRRQDRGRPVRHHQPGDPRTTTRSRRCCATPSWRPRTRTSGTRAASRPPASSAPPTTTSPAPAGTCRAGPPSPSSWSGTTTTTSAPRRPISRKIKEIFVAEKLAQAKSKEWILQQYLNTIYLGGGAYGVGAAAQFYFGLDPQPPHPRSPRRRPR